MKLVFTIFSLFIFNLDFGLAIAAQDPPLATDRSEGLQIKAKLDYEKKARAPMQKPQAKPQASQPQTPAKSAAAPAVQPAASEPVKSESGKSLSCKNGSEIRELVLESKGQGCELFYVKAGQSKSQARQVNGTTICDSVFEKMKSTLEKTGFSCESKKD